MPFCSDIAVGNRDCSDDKLADDNGNDGLPHSEASRHQTSTELEVTQSELIDGPEADERPLCPGPSMRWQWSDVLVDPDIDHTL